METMLVANVEYMKMPSGTYYRVGTPLAVITVLENARQTNKRVRVFYGDTETGRDWCEEFDVMGTVGRSCGRSKVPLLIRSSRSYGGCEISTANIVRITIDKREVYRHPNYHVGTLDVIDYSDGEYPAGVNRDGQNIANFKSKRGAERYVQFLHGTLNRSA